MVKISNTYLIMGQTYKFYTCIPYKKSLKTFTGTYIETSCGKMHVFGYKDSSICMKQHELWTVPIEWITDVMVVSDE
jgi:hypothetical protein